MNETIKNILGRRSVRSYEPKPVESAKIQLIVKCGLYAPSAMNRQPWHFTVITSRKMLERISAANRQVLLKSSDPAGRERANDPGFDSFRGAPMAIIVSGQEEAKYAAADCANAIENMAVAAFSLGLDSCYLGSFKLALEDPEGVDLVRDLHIPAGYKPFYALSLGYGNEELGDRAPRRDGVVTYID